MKFAALLPLLSLTTPILALSETIVGNLQQLTKDTVVVQIKLDAWTDDVRASLGVMNAINLLENDIWEGRHFANISKPVDAKGADAIIKEAKGWGKQLNTTFGNVIRRKPDFVKAQWVKLMLEYTTDSQTFNKGFLEYTLQKVPKGYEGKVKDAWSGSLNAYDAIIAAYKKK